MKYVPPYGRETEGDDAHYINGNPAEATQGSIPPANAFEHPMRELVNTISKSYFAPDETDLLQMAKAVRSQRLNWAKDTSITDDLSVSYDPPLQSYTLGLILHVQRAVTNVGPTTIDAGCGRVAIRKMDGTGTNPGDLPGGGVCALVYDGSAFQLINFGGAGGAPVAGSNFYVNIPYAVDVSTVANIIDATFTLPAEYSLKAGDPFLVKINNTNSGSSIARFRTSTGTLGDKPIQANGGDVLLQGDLQKLDVVLFLYDGTNFWIHPNPIITANTTINVPSQYSTVENALLAIRRKTIAQNATVTIKLAGSSGGAAPLSYAPFVINHANADRLVIAGTLKAAGIVTKELFWQSGNDPASQSSDSARNLTMLRQHYGSEVKVPGGGGPNTFRAGVTNAGPGNPRVQDLLITGPNYWSGNGICAWVGVTVDVSRSINLQNVSAHGLDTGYYGGGVMTGNCFASGCFVNGVHATGLASFGFGESGFFGCQGGGMLVNQNGFMTAYSSWVCSNAGIGVGAGDNSEFTFHTSSAVGNGCDAVAGILSLTMVLDCSIGTWSPAAGVLGGYGELLVKNN